MPVNGWKQRILIVIIIVPVDGTYLNFDNPFPKVFWLKDIEGYQVGESKKLCSLQVHNNIIIIIIL